MCLGKLDVRAVATVTLTTREVRRLLDCAARFEFPNDMVQIRDMLWE